MDESVLGGAVQELNKLTLITDMEFGRFAEALLIDTQAQTAADLLAAADLRLRLGLQHTDLEHIGVVPPLPEGGVREEEPHRFIQAEQPLLVPA